MWWKCSTCGHEWQISPDGRCGVSGCISCAKKQRRIAPDDAHKM
ncbi:MAG TPA: hypothetical protein DC027_04635 [Oscillibacter sp.]|nr:hypothetical protein [Oscillibacter sp.]